MKRDDPRPPEAVAPDAPSGHEPSPPGPPPQPPPVQFTRAVVKAVTGLADGWQEADVGLPEPAFHDARLFGPLVPGQRVIVNSTAVSLGLGTGGSHFICWVEAPSGDAASAGPPGPPQHRPPGRPPNLPSSHLAGPPRDRPPTPPPHPPSDPPANYPPRPAVTPPPLHRRRGHIMKLRYTPLQRRVLTLEELEGPGAGEPLPHTAAGGGDGPARDPARPDCPRPDPPGAPRRHWAALGGMPVVVAGLHSQVAPAAAGIRSILGDDAVIVYVMTDWGALPAGFSRTIAALTRSGIINWTITAGHAYGGDYEGVTPLSALAAGRRRLGAAAAIVAPGPGGAGTASRFGYSAVEQAGLADGVAGAGGRTVACLRVSFADARPRHYGLSHHSVTALRMAARPAFLALPGNLPARQKALIYGRIAAAGLLGRHIPVETGESAALLPAPLIRSGGGYLLNTMGRTAEDDPAFFAAASAAGRLAGKLVSVR